MTASQRLVEALDDRLAASSLIRKNLRKVFPDHWSFMLGECALWSFVALVLTGVFLTFFYVGSSEPTVYRGPYEALQGTEVSQAYASVLRISFEIRAGLVFRQMHHWAALLFLASMVAHMLRVFFTGAFRRPREISWLLGLGLFTLGLGAGFTGYSLPDDLLSGTGLRIAYSVALSIPFVGPWLTFIVFGGEFPTPAIIPRLYVLHILIIPVLIALTVGGHLLLVWIQTHTQHRRPGRTEETVTGSPLWPNYGMKALGLAFGVWSVIALMGGLFQINPVWLYGPFVPYTAGSPAQPDWYLGWLEGLIRLAPNWEWTIFGRTIAEPVLPGVVIPGIAFTILAVWPFLEARVTGDRELHHFLDRPRDAPLRSAIGAAGVAFFGVLLLAGGNDVLATFLHIEVDSLNTFLRWALLLGPVVAFAATWAVCRDLRARDVHPVERVDRATLVRTREGGFAEAPDEAGEPSTPAPD
jgi:ubiquinol-cytochrome c reductase cytochrome b subunit